MTNIMKKIAAAMFVTVGVYGISNGQLSDQPPGSGSVSGETTADKPIFTPKLTFPAGAKQSGACSAKFDVNPQGEPENIVIFDCTDNLYEWPSTIAVKKFRFEPKPTWRRNYSSQLSYDLANEFGIKTAVPGPIELAPAEKAVIASYGDTRSPSRTRKQDNAYCCYDYSVSDRGDAFNVFVKKCSSEEMKETFGTGYKIREWDFDPALKNQLAVSSTGYQAILWFRDNARKVYRGKEEDIAQYCAAP